MFLIDTNVVSELRRPRRTNPRVAAWADSVPPGEMFLSSITILELETGVLLLGRRDLSQARLIQEWIEDRVLRPLPIASWQSIPPSRGDARASMFPIPGHTGIH